MQDELFKTRYSKYGYGIDVRRTYKDLPCQPFWTWVTGKSLNDRPPRRTERHPAQALAALPAHQLGLRGVLPRGDLRPATARLAAATVAEVPAGRVDHVPGGQPPARLPPYLPLHHPWRQPGEQGAGPLHLQVDPVDPDPAHPARRVREAARERTPQRAHLQYRARRRPGLHEAARLLQGHVRKRLLDPPGARALPSGADPRAPEVPLRRQLRLRPAPRARQPGALLGRAARPGVRQRLPGGVRAVLPVPDLHPHPVLVVDPARLRAPLVRPQRARPAALPALRLAELGTLPRPPLSGTTSRAWPSPWRSFAGAWACC